MYLGREVEDSVGDRHPKLIVIVWEKCFYIRLKLVLQYKYSYMSFYMFYIKLVKLYAQTVLKGIYEMTIPGSSYKHSFQSQMV